MKYVTVTCVKTAGRGATGMCKGLVLSALRGGFAFLVRFLFGEPCFFFVVNCVTVLSACLLLCVVETGVIVNCIFIVWTIWAALKA